MSRPVIDVVREYANKQGCVVLRGDSFVSRDGKRSVRFSEVLYGNIIVWDTGTPQGYISLTRGERRPKSTIRSKAQGDALTGVHNGPLEARGIQERSKE
jgi:hypothetical protein